MRVLHIVSSIAQTNGTMNVIMNYYRELINYGIQFDFLYFQKSNLDFSEEIKKNGGQSFFCGEKSKILTITKLTKFLKKCSNYDIIENHELYLTKFIRKRNIPLILHSHTIKFSQKTLSAFRNLLLCKNIEDMADYLFSCSLESAKCFWKKSLKSEKFYIIHNAIPYEKCEYAPGKREFIRKKYNIDSDKIVLGYVARFDYGKNQDFLVEIISMLNRKKSKYILMLVGDGKNKEHVMKDVINKKLTESVIFVGQTPSNQVRYYLSAMDIFLFPSKNEGLGQALIEAQGNGLPCIASTGVPIEAKISSKFLFLPLCNAKNSKLNYNEWVNAISRCSTLRQNVDFYNSGYDIKQEALKLAELYNSIKKSNKKGSVKK